MAEDAQITKKLRNLEDFPSMGTPLVSKISDRRLTTWNVSIA
jgi:hypothetical protein